jgi:hypothetical protein
MDCQSKEMKDPVVKLRKVLKSGKSFYISIPPEFIRLHGIKKGDRLPVLAGHIMKVVPMSEG